MLTTQSDKDSKGRSIRNRKTVFSGKRHVGVIINKGHTGTGKDRVQHILVITPFDSRYVGSEAEALEAIGEDIKDTEYSEVV